MAIQWAKANSIENILIYTDSELLVLYLASKVRPALLVTHIIKDIQHLAPSLEYCRILKVARHNVAPAHNLAKRCKETSFPFIVP